MNPGHIHLLQCIGCRGKLGLSDVIQIVKYEDDPSEIREGLLKCLECGAKYPIIEGTVLFFKKGMLGAVLSDEERLICKRLGITETEMASGDISDSDQRVAKVAENWSFQWNEFYNLETADTARDSFISEDVFFTFIPIDRETIKGATVIVWCGGNGREALHLAGYSPALIIVVELGNEVYRVRNVVGKRAPLLTIRCDMTEHPFKDGFADISICDHALQHVSDHRLAYRKIVAACKTGGKGIAGINVYSYENNIIMTHGIEPMKKILHRLPLRFQLYLSLLPAAGVWLAIRLLYLPAAKLLPSKVTHRMFLFDHMMFWAPSSFKFIWCACFDLIHAPISYHFKKEELLAIAAENGVRVMTMVNTHGTTWSMVARTH